MFKLRNKKRLSQGFTLVEALTITIIIGVLAAVAAPGWFNFLQRQRLNAAQDQIFRALQQAKQKANQESTSWQVSFRENNNVVQWAVHPDRIDVSNVSSWKSLDSDLKVFTQKNSEGKCETTFNKTDSSCPSSPWTVTFNNRGKPSQIGQFTLTTKNSNKPRVCVYVSTLLGTIRTGEYNSSPNSSNKLCY